MPANRWEYRRPILCGALAGFVMALFKTADNWGLGAEQSEQAIGRIIGGTIGVVLVVAAVVLIRNRVVGAK